MTATCKNFVAAIPGLRDSFVQIDLLFQCFRRNATVCDSCLPAPEIEPQQLLGSPCPTLARAERRRFALCSFVGVRKDEGDDCTFTHDRSRFRCRCVAAAAD